MLRHCRLVAGLQLSASSVLLALSLLVVEPILAQKPPKETIPDLAFEGELTLGTGELASFSLSFNKPMVVTSPDSQEALLFVLTANNPQGQNPNLTILRQRKPGEFVEVAIAPAEAGAIVQVEHFLVSEIRFINIVKINEIVNNCTSHADKIKGLPATIPMQESECCVVTCSGATVCGCAVSSGCGSCCTGGCCGGRGPWQNTP